MSAIAPTAFVSATSSYRQSPCFYDDGRSRLISLSIATVAVELEIVTNVVGARLAAVPSRSSHGSAHRQVSTV